MKLPVQFTFLNRENRRELTVGWRLNQWSHILVELSYDPAAIK
jgi:hypothetical protein